MADQIITFLVIFSKSLHLWIIFPPLINHNLKLFSHSTVCAQRAVFISQQRATNWQSVQSVVNTLQLHIKLHTFSPYSQWYSVCITAGTAHLCRNSFSFFNALSLFSFFKLLLRVSFLSLNIITVYSGPSLDPVLKRLYQTYPRPTTHTHTHTITHTHTNIYTHT